MACVLFLSAERARGGREEGREEKRGTERESREGEILPPLASSDGVQAAGWHSKMSITVNQEMKPSTAPPPKARKSISFNVEHGTDFIASGWAWNGFYSLAVGMERIL